METECIATFNIRFLLYFPVASLLLLLLRRRALWKALHEDEDGAGDQEREGQARELQSSPSWPRFGYCIVVWDYMSPIWDLLDYMSPIWDLGLRGMS